METSINNKCKAFTSLEQSKKLAEFLPLESADMIWVLANPDLPMIKAIAYEDSEKSKYYEILPAWSLTSLLSVLPRVDIEKEICSDNTYDYRVKAYIGDGYIGDWYDNPVDACVEMIELLHKQKLL